jgi:molybdopterin-guanine dinucleotide biosynthesis protein B
MCDMATPLLVLAGWSGSGKTTLLEQLLPCLTATGLRVSVVKHSHHAVDFDTPGKDSYRHRAAGAAQVMLLGERGLAVYENLSAPLDLAAQLARLHPVDLVILEGQKWLAVPKLEVHRSALGKPLLQPDDPDILAVASDATLPALAVPQLDLNDIDAIAAFVLRWWEQQA